MGARLQVTYTSINNLTNYRLTIYDSSYAGALKTQFKDGDHWLIYDEMSMFIEPIMSSRYRFLLYDDGTADFTSFRNALAGAQENQFKLLVERYDGVDFVIFWAGVILTDMVTWDNDTVPRPFEIVAVDGLQRLKGIYFDDINGTPYSTSSQSFLKIIYDCLEKSGLSQFWNGRTQPYIKINTTWYDTAQLLDNSTNAKKQTRSLETYRIDRDFLYEHPDLDYEKQAKGYFGERVRSPDDPPLSCYDTLRGILLLLGLRISMSNGSWYIQQITKLVDSTANYSEYNHLAVWQAENSNSLRVAPIVLV